MFGIASTCTLYILQLVSLAIWSRGGLQLRGQLKTGQHAEWYAKAVWLFIGYCMFEFFRIFDCAYTDVETGIAYSVWGLGPWWMRTYSWVLRDILMFRGICVYLEHALVWSHSCMGWEIPTYLLRMQQVGCIFGNVVFFAAVTKYLGSNDQFWQPVAAMGQVPPNIAVAIACYYLYRCLQKVPDCEESRHAIIVNIALLVAAFSCICVFIPWAVPRMLDLYSRQLQVHPAFPAGASIFYASPPPFSTISDRKLDLSLELVELTVGWCGFMGLKLRAPQEAVPGQPLVYSSEEIGRLVARDGTKKKC